MDARLANTGEDANVGILCPSVDPAVAAIDRMDRAECASAWRKQFRFDPPSYISVRLMRRILAYEVQVKVRGGHSAQVKRALAMTLKNGDRVAGKPALAARSPASLRPGIHLVREWNGRSYLVEVLEEGFRMDGRTYRSLTAIASKITGTAWSGPRFFGLKRR